MVKSKSRYTAVLFLILHGSLAAQDAGLDAMKALDEWRWGVLAYNDGLPGKALLAMERAISLSPRDPNIREWLGRTYWRSGLENAALDIWDELVKEENASIFLQKWTEDIRHRLTSPDTVSAIEEDWIALAAFDGSEIGFAQPASIRSLGDNSGRLFISSYGGGNLLMLDANGQVLDQFEGGIEGLLRPFDILPIGKDRLLASEFQGDRLSLLSMEGLNRGYRVETWGESGLEDDRFLGPQYMALSPDGEHVYVSDWGNKRVSKWRIDGTHILNFEGFSGPTGIVCQDERVFVADSLKASIEVFDPSGNHLGPFIDTGLTKPEGLAFWKGSILIADEEKVLRADLTTGALHTLFSLGEGDHRITSVFPADNGNIVVSDFDANQVSFYAAISTLYSGLTVRIDRILAEAYPELTMTVTVTDKLGSPIVGLDTENFRISAGNIPVAKPVLDWQSWKEEAVSIVSVLDMAGGASGLKEFFRGIDDMRKEFQTGDEFAALTTAPNPVPWEIAQNADADVLYGNLIANTTLGTAFWESAIRLAANRIAPARSRKAVVAFVSKPPLDTAFDEFGLVETARLMANNGIVFHVVYAEEGISSRELNYIARETGGGSSLLYQPDGSGKIIRDLRKTPLGSYSLSWQSKLDTGFGRRFLPLSVEVIYLGKSGRAESGTFSPLQ